MYKSGKMKCMGMNRDMITIHTSASASSSFLWNDFCSLSAYRKEYTHYIVHLVHLK